MRYAPVVVSVAEALGLVVTAAAGVLDGAADGRDVAPATTAVGDAATGADAEVLARLAAGRAEGPTVDEEPGAGGEPDAGALGRAVEALPDGDVRGPVLPRT